MICVRCLVSAAVSKVTIGKVTYPMCSQCEAKVSHPAYQLAEMVREQDRVAKATR